MLTYNDTNGSNPLFDDDVLNTFLNSSVAYPDCEDDALSLSSTSNSLTMDTFFEDTDYTSEFLVQKNAWLANAYQYSPLTGQTLRILPLGGKSYNIPQLGTIIHNCWRRSSCLFQVEVPSEN